MRIQLGISLLALGLAAPLANAAMIVSHSADANPMLESPAWGAGGILPGSPATGMAVLGVNDSGTKAWQITDTSPTDCLYYAYSSPSLVAAATTGSWTATAKMRVASNNSSHNYSASLYIFDGTYDVVLSLVGTAANEKDNGLWYSSKDGTPVQVYGFDTATAYHNYQFIYNAEQTDRYTVYIDGNNVGFIPRSNIPVFVTTPLIGFGAISGPGQGSSDWNKVMFETGQVMAPFVPLPGAPEPASLGLLGLGVLGLLGRRRA